MCICTTHSFGTTNTKSYWREIQEAADNRLFTMFPYMDVHTSKHLDLKDQLTVLPNLTKNNSQVLIGTQRFLLAVILLLFIQAFKKSLEKVLPM